MTHILVTCQYCGRTLKAPVSAIGRVGTCPKCQSKVLIQEFAAAPTSITSPLLTEDGVQSNLGEHSAEVTSSELAHAGEAAEKPEPAPASGRAARKESYSADRIKTVIDKIDESRHRLAELHAGLTTAGVDEISVDGHAMLLRGLNQIENFIDNASRALREAKREKAHT